MFKLKTALFGYKKTQVCEYINNLSDELTQNYEQKIQALQAENTLLKKQIEEQNEIAAVSEIIIEAKNFAQGLKDKAAAEHQACLRKMKETDDRLSALRKSIGALLLETDTNLNNIQKEIDSLQEQAQV